jgi:hypothetical protein
LQVYRLATLARTGEYAEAVTEAEKFLPQARAERMALYSFARVYAIGAATAKADEKRPPDDRARLAEAWSAKAVQLLIDAKDLDYFRYSQRLTALDADVAFAILRDRKDYQTFRATLKPPG